MFRVIVEGAAGSGKSFFIEHFLTPVIAMAQSLFPNTMGKIEVIERFPGEK